MDAPSRFTLWIDADACPGAVKDVVFRAAARLSLPVVLVANKPMFTPPPFEFRLVPKTSDAADHLILQDAQPGDIVVTQDIPLAADLAAKNVLAITPRGKVYTLENVGEALSLRNHADAMRGAGFETSGPPPFSPQDKQQFANALDRALTQRLKGL